jgi:hypothetical protein
LIQAHLGDLRSDGFVVALETADEVDATLEVAHDNGPFVALTHARTARHRLRVSGLSPREQVRWRVVAGGAVLAEGEGQAGPADDSPALEFLVYGDTRSGEDDERQIAIAAAGGAPAFVLHTGDIVPSGDDDSAWARLFEVEQPLLGHVPLYLAIGNHELYRDTEATRVRRYVVFHGGGDSTYYSFRVGPARIIALDSNRPDEAQTEWLARTLAEAAVEPGRPHVFIFLHHPPFSTGGHCGSAIEEAAWVELFERFRPSAVFGGHDHAYERLERNGVRYFVTGGGGAPLYPERERCPEHDRIAKRVYRAEHHVLRVRLRGEAIEVEVARPAGPPIEVLRWSRGDPFPAAPVPVLIDERRPTGLFRPLVTSIAVAALAGLLVLVARRRRG